MRRDAGNNVQRKQLPPHAETSLAGGYQHWIISQRFYSYLICFLTFCLSHTFLPSSYIFNSEKLLRVVVAIPVHLPLNWVSNSLPLALIQPLFKVIIGKRKLFFFYPKWTVLNFFFFSISKKNVKIHNWWSRSGGGGCSLLKPIFSVQWGPLCCDRKYQFNALLVSLIKQSLYWEYSFLVWLWEVKHKH